MLTKSVFLSFTRSMKFHRPIICHQTACLETGRTLSGPWTPPTLCLDTSLLVQFCARKAAEIDKVFFCIRNSRTWLNITYCAMSSLYAIIHVRLPVRGTQRPCPIIALAGKEMRSVVSVSPFIPFPHSFWTSWLFDLDFCVCTGHDHSSPVVESQGHR